MRIANYVIITLMGSLFVLLAIQAEPVTATLGFVCAGILMLALIAGMVRKK